MRYSWAIRAVLSCAPLICVFAAGYAAEQNTIPLRNIPGAPLKMGVPPGYCEINPSRTETERFQFSLLEKGLKEGAILAYLADCASHADLDKVVALESWIVVVGKLSNNAVQPEPGYTRAKFLDAMAAAAPRSVAAGVADGASDAEQVFKEFGVDMQMQIKTLGLLGRDTNGIYQGIALRQVANGQTFNVVGVGGATYVKNYVIAVSMYRHYRSPQTITELLTASKQLHRDFIALNEPAR